MEKTMDADEYGHYLAASALVEAWMIEYKRYLLDGDPNILHPKARAALVVDISTALGNVKRPKGKAKPDAKAG
jgi:hypothetical protein